MTQRKRTQNFTTINTLAQEQLTNEKECKALRSTIATEL